MIQQILSALKAFGQLLAHSLLDHAWSGEADECVGLGCVDITEHGEAGGDATIQLSWERRNAYPDWKGEYWSNRFLRGAPAVVRDDPDLGEDDPGFAFDWGAGMPALDLPIDANSSERVTDRSQPDDSALDPLRSLESGDTDSLPFSLEGRVHTLDDGYLRFEQKGHLYRVPGRPGQFRAAVMRASELVRENKL